GIVVAFTVNWKLSLVILTISPIIFIATIIGAKIVSLSIMRELAAYSKADYVAQEVFGAVRTVFAFNGQEYEQQRYTLPHFQIVSEACGAVQRVLQIIDHNTSNEQKNEKRDENPDIEGDIEFDNVHFSYPARQDTKILDGLSFSIKTGETVALCGQSGSGKSTIMHLLLRFYELETSNSSSGSIRIGNHLLKEYNLERLRKQIGVVGQEPVLFSTTIYENIQYGKENATREEIEDAAKQANAHEFIMKLPDRYQTLVGERGIQLSGGEKQRVAIARALINQPKLLLLDEATSALDNESERLVQDALHRACKGRTTIIIAHRLSTIRNVDRIYVLHKGRTIEQGNHETLIGSRGYYYSIIQIQQQPDVDSDGQQQEEEEMEEEEEECEDNSRKSIVIFMNYRE
ncbi:unnamed protein product, partial [Didymodactylos carnosus]